MGYVELADFHEIWPELSLSIEEQKGVGDFLYHGYFCCDLSLIILDITKPHPIIVKKTGIKREFSSFWKPPTFDAFKKK